MNSLAVKAAELRAKYITDKYYYGIECNKCDYGYKSYAINDFIQQCFDICIEEPVISSVDESYNCTITIEYIPAPACEGPTITNCEGLITIEVNNVELDQEVIDAVNVDGEAMAFDIKHLKLNGQYILLNPEPVTINSGNLDTTSYGLFTNVVTYLNSLQDKIIFSTSTTQNRLRIQYPAGASFELKTEFSTAFTHDTRGVIITHNGLQGVQTASGGAYQLIGGDWVPYYKVIETQTLC